MKVYKRLTIFMHYSSGQYKDNFLLLLLLLLFCFVFESAVFILTSFAEWTYQNVSASTRKCQNHTLQTLNKLDDECIRKFRIIRL